MKRIERYLKVNLIYLILAAFLAGPVMITITSCGDKITGPKVIDDKNDKPKEGGEDKD